MAIRSGLAAQLGMVAEATYGTYLAPTRFLEFISESLSLSVERIESEALRAGNSVLRDDRWAANRKGVEGSIELEVASKGFGLPLRHMLGSSVITQPDVTGNPTVYVHTHTLADLYGSSLTMQVGRPDVAGVVQPFSYTGIKVAEWALSSDLDAALMLSLTLDGQNEATNQGLAAASFAADDELLYYTGGSITVAGTSFDVTSFSLEGSNALKTDRYFVRANTLKKEPIRSSFVGLTGTLEAEFDNLTAYNRFVNGTYAALTAKWEGSTISGTYKYALEITLPVVRFDGTTPQVSGPDVLTQSLPFKALNDGVAQPITILYRTTDSAS